VTLRTADGLELAGWYVPSLNGAGVIAFPGRSGPVPHARMLANHGYGILLVDMRGQGASEGDPNAFGWGSSEDLDAAVAFLQDRPDVRDGRIGGLGLSVGGELLLETAAGNPALRAVVSEGAGWRSVRESFARKGPSQLELWLQAPTDAVLTAATVVLSGTTPPPALDELVAEIAPRPVYLIYGEHGDGGERALTPAYYAAGGQPKTLWEVPGARHTGGLDAQPQEYERRVVGFFDRALLASGEEPSG
jgi:dienelactone hydrolase